ncbi:MAG: HAD-IIB family hydrolase [Pirellulaceae bacterium]
MYIQLLSVHGLIRGDRVEMGRDADTGGQVRYVLELAKTLAEFPCVEQVDLFTRLIEDPSVDDSYRQPIEMLSENCRLVRVPFGPQEYLRKEKLWPHLDECAERIIEFTRGEDRQPDFVHGHYADAGYAARRIAREFGCPFLFTGHSLGIPKLDYLTSEGWSEDRADEVLHIRRRIAEEQACLDEAAGVVVSTRHERDQQYGGYALRDGLSVEVIPPGTDLERFFPYYAYETPGEEIDERCKQARHRMHHRLSRFLSNPDRPLLLALCRPDRRKNIQSLIKAYGESPALQAIANLAIFAGIREDIESMPENEQSVLTDILLLMDRYDLYGKLAIPKHHDSDFDVPELYRIAASSRGLFVNTAFIELFGLTAIEASATGLPFVVTENGGPQDIVANCRSGKLVDVNDQDALIDAMLELLTDSQQWSECSDSGINLVRQFYSWRTHCESYLSWIKLHLGIGHDPIEVREAIPITAREEAAVPQETEDAPNWSPAMKMLNDQLASAKALLITDIDGTLIGDDRSLQQLLRVIDDLQGEIVLGVASGRSPELVQEVLEKYGIDQVSLVIASVGSEILVGPNRELLVEWSHKINSGWEPSRLTGLLRELPWLELQTEPHTQRPFKVSYRLRDVENRQFIYQQLQAVLESSGLPFTLVVSHGNLVDVLPAQASKGQAIRFLLRGTQFPTQHLFTAGDSGNDLDMLCGEGGGIVVGNHAEEVKCLRDLEDARFTSVRSRVPEASWTDCGTLACLTKR